MMNLEEVNEMIKPIENWVCNVESAEALSIIATLFDFICEIHGLDKTVHWNYLGNVIKEVNEELGPMMEENEKAALKRAAE